MVSASYDATVRAWDCRYVGATGKGLSGASPRPQASQSPTLHPWCPLCRRSHNNSPIQVLSEFTDSVSKVLATANEIIASCIDGCVRIYDLRAGKLRTDKFPGAYLLRVCVSVCVGIAALLKSMHTHCPPHPPCLMLRALNWHAFTHVCSSSRRGVCGAVQ